VLAACVRAMQVRVCAVLLACCVRWLEPFGTAITGQPLPTAFTHVPHQMAFQAVKDVKLLMMMMMMSVKSTLLIDMAH
jgi:hypothetical protein